MIADPMADLTGEGTPGPAAEMGSQKEVFNPMVLQVNMQRVDRIRSIMGIASGCVAGILGLTGLRGLGKWIVMPSFSAAVCLARCTHLAPHDCTLTSPTWDISVLCRSPLVCVALHLGVQDELQAFSIFEAIALSVPDSIHTGHRSVVYSFLDTLLRTCILILTVK
jgi:EMC6